MCADAGRAGGDVHPTGGYEYAEDKGLWLLMSMSVSRGVQVARGEGCVDLYVTGCGFGFVQCT